MTRTPASRGPGPGISNSPTLTVCVTVLTALAVGFTAYALRSILIPFLLALFLLLVIGGFEEVLTRRVRLPPRAALPAAIVAVVAMFGLSIWLIVHNAEGIAADSGAYASRLDVILKMFADKVGLAAAPTIDSLFHQANPARFAPVVAKEAGHVLEGAVFVLVYLAFMLASRAGFGAKVAEIFRDAAHEEAVGVARRIQAGVESYVWVQTLVGLIIAGASILLMWPMGISHLLFWAFLIFLANYIPAIGAAIGVLLPPLFGLVELNDLWRPIALLVGLEAIHFGVSHIVQPRMQGASLNIDPIVVLLSLAFWGAIFGIAGAFLSTPLTVVVMVVCAEFDATHWVAILLSEDGKPKTRDPPES